MNDEIDFNEVFNDSFEFVLNNSTEFYELFYTNFVNSSPLVKKAFKNTDMDKQSLMLKTAIVNLVNFVASKKADKYLVLIARRHHNLNIEFDLYDLFMHSLLATLDQLYPKFNSECAAAWRITLAPGFEFMKHVGAIEQLEED